MQELGKGSFGRESCKSMRIVALSPELTIQGY